MGILSSLFGKKKSVDFAELISQGAQIIDVRTPSEYSNGHLKASKNIPLDRLASSVSKIDKNKPVITCCASGMRSSSALGILLKAGFTEVYNGGPWTSLRSYTK
jgi:rhodanese-related sulfurtransferase